LANIISKTLAQALGLILKRILTPDLMPSDILEVRF
jgi:hypothetical protein